MVFSSLVFVCIFLPVVFLLHTIIPSIRVRNALLIVASLLFYAYGEPVYVVLMIISALLNYLFARLMKRRGRKIALFLAVLANIGMLCVFKYAGFFIQTLNSIAHLNLAVPQITLPIGISFFTFQALSYVIDVYRGNTVIQNNFFKVLLYISFFPQLIAGPIVKYRDVEAEINERTIQVDEIAYGMRRFILGLSKKVLIANTMAIVADQVFARGIDELNALPTWIGAVAYTMQIYFDFSGYSDMAIGMGRMFGFHFKENFDLPYTARTIKEFWRRWHISLSSWFKEYVYIPLGGNRKGKMRTGINKLIVFFLCGLWHGASWTFVLWGLFHGVFSFLEEAVKGIRKLPRILGHIYTMLVVIIGFVIFRADSVSQAGIFIKKMFTGFLPSRAATSFALQQLTPFFIAMFIAAILFCGPLAILIRKTNNPKLQTVRSQTKKAVAFQTLGFVASIFLLGWCVLRLSSGSYNPFIYFRF